MEVYFGIDATVSAKHVKVDLKPNMFSISINNKVLKSGTFFQEILPDDCNWQLDGDGASKKVWITIAKKFATKGNQHWKYFLKGDPEVDLSMFGAPVHAIDPNMDKAMLRKKFEEVMIANNHNISELGLLHIFVLYRLKAMLVLNNYSIDHMHINILYNCTINTILNTIFSMDYS